MKLKLILLGLLALAAPFVSAQVTVQTDPTLVAQVASPIAFIFVGPGPQAVGLPTHAAGYMVVNTGSATIYVSGDPNSNPATALSTVAPGATAYHYVSGPIWVWSTGSASCTFTAFMRSSGVSPLAGARAQFNGLRPCVDGVITLGSQGNFTAGKDTSVSSLTGFVASGSLTHFCLVYQGFQGQNTGDQLNHNTELIRASAELLPGGSSPSRVTFHSAQQGTLDPGGTLVSDPVWMNVPCTATTSAVAAGNSVSIPVSSSAGFQTGQSVLVGSAINVCSNGLLVTGTYDSATITSIPDATHLVVGTVLFPHPAGTTVNSVVYVRSYGSLVPIYSGTCTGGSSASPGTVVLSTATPNDPRFNVSGKFVVAITGGTGSGEYGTIASYNSATNTATLTGAWSGGNNGTAYGTYPAPDSTSTYAIYDATQLMAGTRFSSATAPVFPGEKANPPYANWPGVDQTSGSGFTGYGSSLHLSPVFLVGDSASPSVALTGDSIMQGIGAGAETNAVLNTQPFTKCSFGDIQLFPSIASINQACSGDSVAHYTSNSWPYRNTLAQICDNQIVAFGTNDLNALGHTCANFEQDLYNYGAYLVSASGAPYFCTIPPVTADSTDIFTTVAAQTIPSPSFESYRQQFNCDQRSTNHLLGLANVYVGSFASANLPMPYLGCIDRAAMVEVTNLGSTSYVATTASGSNSVNPTKLTVTSTTNVLPGLQMVVGLGSNAELVTVASLTGNVATLTASLLNNHAGDRRFSCGFWNSGAVLATGQASHGSATTLTDPNLVNLRGYTKSPIYNEQVIQVNTGGNISYTNIFAYDESTGTITFGTTLGTAVNSTTTYTIFQNYASPTPNPGIHPSTYGHYQMSLPILSMVAAGLFKAR